MLSYHCLLQFPRHNATVRNQNAVPFIRRQRILCKTTSRNLMQIPTSSKKIIMYSSHSTHRHPLCATTISCCYYRTTNFQCKKLYSGAIVNANETLATKQTSMPIRWNSSTSSTASSKLQSANNTHKNSNNESTSKIDIQQEDAVVDALKGGAGTTSKDDQAEESKNMTDTTTNATMREKIRERISETRTAAVAQMKEFADHPGQSAAEGAKSFSGMLRRYGPVFIGTYGCVYFTTLGLLFSGVQSGALDPMILFSYLDSSHHPSEHNTETATTVHLVYDFMMNHTITRPYAPIIEQHPAFANLAVAWIAVKFTEPIRLPIALALTPRVSNFLGYTGKPVSSPTVTTTTDTATATKENTTSSTSEDTTAIKK